MSAAVCAVLLLVAFGGSALALAGRNPYLFAANCSLAVYWLGQLGTAVRS